ncbi:exosome complex exonuclease Rrp [Ophiocordyceps camponoti-floridani]|uniref:Exosome complex exonuclease Rrp n=1 Tax=Ophiocordyceps camponoti-floridani TaxID=2030778 RepID=A0A8H4Q567_9HYPO|nr:exosome complex exonuclease Rrp [Ophiocordyceps camponoti-floridani]
MEDAPDFESQQKRIQKSLVSTVKTVNRLAAEDLQFQRTVNPDTARQLDESASRALDLSTRLLQAAARACKVQVKGKAKEQAPKIEDVDDIDLKWSSIVDVVDSVLEKADTALDEFTGLIKRREPPPGEQTPTSRKSTGKVIRNADVSKPQLLFEKKQDNFPTEPWKPILTTKPHAILSLSQSLVLSPREDGTLQYKHPYEHEITNMQYPDRLFEIVEPIPYQPVESTSATWVDTYDGVLDMLAELKKADEIAVDLEHHDFRTYTGLVCLMQISTREKDWIVDTLQPWRHKLEILNEVFADPKIIKVFHGAYMDMVWLQRDLGLYVNGLFDTFFASNILNFPSRSLAFLLSKFVDFSADKQYQLADWRIRPIPPEMMYYARSDTHYLLYIFDHLRNELCKSDLSNSGAGYTRDALERSRELALSRHEHPEFDKETGRGSRGWYNYVLKQAHLGFDSQQFAVFRAMWEWRDAVAREEDENPNFVLGTNQILSIVRVNPPDVKALHGMLPYTASLARARFVEMWERIRDAKAQGGPSLLKFFSSQTSDVARKPAAKAATVEKTPVTSEQGDAKVASLKQSQLFGDMAISTRWEAGSHEFNGTEDSLPFPWQRFVEGSAETGDGGADEKTSEEAQTENTGDIETAQAKGTDGMEAVQEVEDTAAETTAEVASKVADDDKDDEVILKRGKKRKSKAVEDKEVSSAEQSGEKSGMDEADDGVLCMDEDEEPSDSKRASKKQRQKEHEEKAQKAHKKTQRREERRSRKVKKRQQRQQQANEAPFDYSKAASVLHAGQGSTRERAKVFDPYAKTADEGLKGARKAPPVRGERSATFKG